MRRSVWLSLTAFAATAVPVGWGLPHRFHVEGMPYVAGILPAGLEGVPCVAGILPAGVEGVSPSNRGQGAANAFSRVGAPPEALGTRGRDARDTVVGQAPPYRSAFASQDPNRVVRIVVLQAGRAHSKQGNPGSEANFHLLAGLAREAAKSQPDLIVFPEYAISGWPYPREEIINGLAETIPGDGPWYLRYQALARETRTALLGWLVEKEGDKLYNCSFLVDPNGAFVGKYRKVQANLGEQTWWGWSQGESFQPIEYRGVKYGISICADMWFPETVRCEELLGAHVIVHVSIADDMMHIIPTRAFDSEIPIVLAIFNGGSYAVDPQGKLLDKLPAETPGWKVFALQPFQVRMASKYGGLWIPRLGNQNTRHVEAYGILVDPNTRPPWTEVFRDGQGRRQTREQLLKRFRGRYDAKDPAMSRERSTKEEK